MLLRARHVLFGRRGRFAVAAAALLLPTVLMAFEAGNLSVNQPNKTAWHAVTFDSPFDTPPVVVLGPLSFNGGDPSTLRSRSISTTGFEFQIDEYDYKDGSHTTEDLSYLAVAPGVIDIEGIPAIAGRLEEIGKSFQKVEFEKPFESNPVILFQVESHEAGPALVARARNVSSTGFEIRIQAEEKNQGPLPPQTVSFIALETGDYFLAHGQPISVGTTGNRVTHNWFSIAFEMPMDEPIFLAHTTTSDGGNTAGLRYRRLDENGVQVKVEEEQSLDAEIGHITEEVGYVVIGGLVDTDEDGLPNAWERRHGLDPEDPSDALQDNDGDGRSNRQEFADRTDPNEFDGKLDGGTIRLTTENPNAYEKELLNGSFRLTRTGSDAAVPVHLVFEHPSDPTKGFATADDYLLVDSQGTPLPNPIPLEVDQRNLDVYVVPIRDSEIEVPETLIVRILPSPTYQLSSRHTAEIVIRDATNTPENERLFVATLTSEGGAETTASGLSTIRVQGDNSFGLVNLGFSGLTSAQTAVHIHIANPISGPPVESLDLGQVRDHFWVIRAAQFLTTDQAVLDALVQGQLYVNVHSAEYPAGEIRGDYRQQRGSVEFTLPEPASDYESLSGEALERDIARFLQQATFGPTPALMAEVKAHIAAEGDRIGGMARWIQKQMEDHAPISLLALTQATDRQEAALAGEDFRIRSHNLRHGWWAMAVAGHDPLRQRVAFALSQIFVVSTRDSLVNNRHYGAAHYYDMLANGAFGSYRNLLEGVARHPIMGHYLSHLRNQKKILDDEGAVLVSPDENFAREIMQLFSIGLVQLHPDGAIRLNAQGLPISTYNQTDITELARVFTGLSFSRRNWPRNSDTVRVNNNFNYGNGSRYFQAQWLHPMKFFESRHDQDPKTLLGEHTLRRFQGGERDLDAALDILTAHPNTAPFICRRLIQRLVCSNPSPGYLYRVSTVFTESDGDFGSVIPAILLDPEARNLTAADRVDAGKQKEPIIRYLGLMRALNVRSELPLADLVEHGYSREELAKFPRGTSLYRMGNTDNRLGQTPQGAPTVFNWFLPDFTVAGPLAAAGLVAPEFQLTTESQVVNAANAHYTLLFNRFGQGGVRFPGPGSNRVDDMKPDLTPFLELLEAAEDNNATPREAATLLIDFADILFSGGTLKARSDGQIGTTSRDIMIDAVAATRRNNKVKTALYLYVTSPDYITQK